MCDQISRTAKVAIITLVALMLSVLLTAALSLALDGHLTPKPLAIASICAVLVAMPIAHFVLAQTEKLAKAHADLTDAHRQLSKFYHQLESAHSEMEYEAHHDAMTGLVNRASFLANLEGLRRDSDSGYLLMIDVDRFKRVNDTYGHDTGDRVLVAIADALRSATRESDICARIGGEEFAVYLPGADFDQAYLCSERLRLAVAAKRVEMANGGEIGVTVSIGGAPYESGETIDRQMRAADQLLYQAKKQGRDRTCFAMPVQDAA
jgi:diguanylate cyclase (GGDEF)-like protein